MPDHRCSMPVQARQHGVQRQSGRPLRHARRGAWRGAREHPEDSASPWAPGGQIVVRAGSRVRSSQRLDACVWLEMWVHMDSAWVNWQLAPARWSADGLCGSRVDMLCMHMVEVGRMRSFLALDLVKTRGISKEFFFFNLRVFVKE